jgi:RNA recognition motif-containing protein
MNDVQLKPFKPYLITPSSRFKFGEYSRTYTIEVNTNYDILRNQEISKKVIDTTEDSDEDEENTIFVGQIPHEATEKQIFDFFKSCGSIKKISYPIDKQTMLPRGIAFVTFDNSSSLLQALSRDRDIMLGRPVRIKKNVLKSKPNTEQNDKNRSSKNSDNYNPNRDKSSKYRDSASSSDRLYTESFRRDERQSPPHKRKFGEANR